MAYKYICILSNIFIRLLHDVDCGQGNLVKIVRIILMLGRVSLCEDILMVDSLYNMDSLWICY